MKPFKNARRDAFFAEIPVTSVDLPDNTHASRSKFNFSYFTVQPAGQAFADWDHNQLCKLFEKLAHYGAQSLTHWRNERCGGGTVLAIYDRFPVKTEFTLPAHVPHQAMWGRFRLESKVRLVGFILPPAYEGQTHNGSKAHFCCNTFYVVFLDLNHKFYLTEAN